MIPSVIIDLGEKSSISVRPAARDPEQTGPGGCNYVAELVDYARWKESNLLFATRTDIRCVNSAEIVDFTQLLILNMPATHVASAHGIKVVHNCLTLRQVKIPTEDNLPDITTALHILYPHRLSLTLARIPDDSSTGTPVEYEQQFLLKTPEIALNMLAYYEIPIAKVNRETVTKSFTSSPSYNYYYQEQKAAANRVKQAS